MLTTILVFILLVLVIYSYFLDNSRLPPGPIWRPLIGHGRRLRQMAKKFGGLHYALTEFSKIYQSDVVGLTLGQEYVIAVSSYDTILELLKSDEFLGRPDNFFIRLRTMGKRLGVTGTDGELWKDQRTFVVSHLRAVGYGKTLMEDMVKNEVRQFIEQIGREKQCVDISSILAPSVLNILWTLTSGRANLKANTRSIELLKLLKKRSTIFDMSGGILNYYPWLRFIIPEKTGYNLVQQINRQIRDFIMEIVDEHKVGSNGDDDLIYSYLREISEGKNQYFNEAQLTMICLDIFIAGSATTSNTIDFALLAMILYPDVQEKVFESLQTNFPNGQEISYSDRTQLPYIEAVLLESQRFFQVVPVIGPRRALNKTTLGRYIIPKNTTVLINLHSVHHDKQFWKDPDVFRPERFLDESSNVVNQERVLTFGLGKRKCLGDALAKTCIFLFFVEILRKYRIDSIIKPSSHQIPGMVLTPEPYTAQFIPRSC